MTGCWRQGNAWTSGEGRCRISCPAFSAATHRTTPVLAGISDCSVERTKQSASVSKAESLRIGGGNLSPLAPQSTMVVGHQIVPAVASFSWSFSCQYSDQSSRPARPRRRHPNRSLCPPCHQSSLPYLLGHLRHWYQRCHPHS